MVAVPWALASKPNNSIFLCMSLATPKLLSLCWSPWASESVCGLFKGMSGFPASLHLTQMVRILTDFYSHILWGLLFLALNPWTWEHQCGAEGTCSSKGTSTAKIPLLLLDCHMQMQGQPISCLRPSYQSQCSPFFISLVIGVLFG